MNAKIMPESLSQELPLSEPMEPADDQDLDPAQQAEVCLRLWQSALAQFVGDAVRHAVGGRKPFHVDAVELQAAYFDLVELGPMLTHLCNHTGDDPEWIRDRALDAIDDHRDGVRRVIRTSTKRGGRRNAVPV